MTELFEWNGIDISICIYCVHAFFNPQYCVSCFERQSIENEGTELKDKKYPLRRNYN